MSSTSGGTYLVGVLNKGDTFFNIADQYTKYYQCYKLDM